MTRWTFPMFAASLILSGEMKGYAEQTARQSFHVHVSPRMAIRCPTFALSPPPLPLELQSPVPQQDWEVSTNSRCGATIQIATEHQ